MDEAGSAFLWDVLGTNGFCIVHIWLHNQTQKMFPFSCTATVTAADLECQQLSAPQKLYLHPWARNNQHDLGFALCRTGFWFFLSTAFLEIPLLKGSTVLLAQASQHQAIRAASGRWKLNHDQYYNLKAPPCIHVQLWFERANPNYEDFFSTCWQGGLSFITLDQLDPSKSTHENPFQHVTERWNSWAGGRLHHNLERLRLETLLPLQNSKGKAVGILLMPSYPGRPENKSPSLQ